jgi:chromosome segregation ATPase
LKSPPFQTLKRQTVTPAIVVATMPLRDTQNHPARPIAQHHSNKRRASEGTVPQEEDAQYWHDMFWSLKRERETEAEALLQAFAVESEKREESLKTLVHHLEIQVEDLKEALEQSEQVGKEALEASKQLNQEADELRTTIQKQQHEITLYRTLTAASLSNIDASKEVAFDCLVVNPEIKQSTSFRLESSEKEALLIKYEPLSQPNASLPVFLHEAIEFHVTQTPALMQNVLKSMFPDDDE